MAQPTKNPYTILIRDTWTSNGYDYREEDDSTPFRELINEFNLNHYSKKIKEVFKTRGLAWKHTSSCPPYGYLKAPEDKNQWMVDDEASAVVKQILQLTKESYGPCRINIILEEE